MEFSCSRQKLHEVLGVLSSIVPLRSTKPVLQNIRMEAIGKEAVELAATDLDVGVRMTLEVENLTDPGDVVLPSGKLNSIVRDAWGEKVTVRIVENKAEILTEGARFEVLGESADEFPDIPALDEAQSVEIKAEDLAEAIAQTSFAAAREEARYSLAGIHLALSKKQLDMVATDTFRLALSRKGLRGNVSSPTSATILAKGMQELSKLLAGEELVELQLTDTQFFARTSRATLVSRLIEGRFPQYANVIPKDLDKKVTVDRERFMQALRQAAILANEETHAVNLTAGAGSLKVQAASLHGGEACIELAAEVEGGEVSISFNYGYLLDVLKVLSDEKVTLHLRDAESPARIDIRDYTYVVSPVCPR
ncbi:MAG: DNA polymerase III subunit beta [Planctomycetota bacterium]